MLVKPALGLTPRCRMAHISVSKLDNRCFTYWLSDKPLSKPETEPELYNGWPSIRGYQGSFYHGNGCILTL